MQKEQELILASRSPRRLELLTKIGLALRVVYPTDHELPVPGEDAETMVRRLALRKAQEVAEKNPQAWVLGADTVVAIGKEILGKPCDNADAMRMLMMLQGATHQVWGSIALCNVQKKKSRVKSVETHVEMIGLSPEQAAAYAASGEPCDKAGAYGIQGIASGLVRRIGGSYTNVVGLDLSSVIMLLLEQNVISAKGEG